MEFDIGNLFYIIITLLVIIVGVLGKKRKPAGQATDGSEGVSKPGFLENLEKAFNMGQETQVVADYEDYETDIKAEEEAEIPEVETAPEAMGIMEAYEQMIARRPGEMENDIVFTGTEIADGPLEVIQLDDEGGTDYYEVVEDFNAATAVVYAAIINRIDY